MSEFDQFETAYKLDHVLRTYFAAGLQIAETCADTISIHITRAPSNNIHRFTESHGQHVGLFAGL